MTATSPSAAPAIRVAIAGASGRMGRMLIEAVRASGDCVLAGALDIASSPAIGSDATAFLGVASGVPITADVRAGLANADVLGDFAAKGVTLLRADWTRRDPAITAALQALGRSGVPVYVLYKPGQPPVVFSEILGTAELRSALGSL